MDAPVPPRILSEKDEKDLRLLAVCHYALGALTAALALLGVPLLRDGRHLMAVGERVTRWPWYLLWVPEPLLSQDPGYWGMMVFLTGMCAVALFPVHGLVTAWVGWFLAKRKQRMVTLVFEALNLGLVPFGTLLGIWTMVVLFRPSVQRAFDGTPPSVTPAGGAR